MSYRPRFRTQKNRFDALVERHNLTEYVMEDFTDSAQFNVFGRAYGGGGAPNPTMVKGTHWDYFLERDKLTFNFFDFPEGYGIPAYIWIEWRMPTTDDFEKLLFSFNCYASKIDSPADPRVHLQYINSPLWFGYELADYHSVGTRFNIQGFIDDVQQERFISQQTGLEFKLNPRGHNLLFVNVEGSRLNDTVTVHSTLDNEPLGSHQKSTSGTTPINESQNLLPYMNRLAFCWRFHPSATFDTFTIAGPIRYALGVPV